MRFEAVVVDLDVGVLLAVNPDNFDQRLACLFLITGAKPFVHRTGNTTGQTDEALGILPQRVAVHAGFAVVETLEITLGNELAQIAPALVGLCQERHVSRTLATDKFLSVLHFSGREVDLAAEDRLHPGLVAVLIELDRAVEVAVVGHRHRWHAEFLGALGKILGADHAIEKGEFGV